MGRTPWEVGSQGPGERDGVNPGPPSVGPPESADDLEQQSRYRADTTRNDDFREQIILRLSDLGFQLAAAASVTTGPALTRLQLALRQLDDLIRDLRKAPEEPDPSGPAKD
jgi:hypothetical protein